MTDALENVARSSTFQENQYFINDIPIFKLRTHNLLMIGQSKSIKLHHSLIKTLVLCYNRVNTDRVKTSISN